jgi:uncharacterized membrane protein/YHS domain-containing protein
MNSIAKQSRVFVVLAFLFMALWSPSVWAQTSSPESAGEEGQPANAMCPVTTDEEIDPNFSAVYEGREIFFCCKKCRTKFEADPEAYVANLPDIVPVALQTTPEVQTEGTAQPHDEQAGHDEQGGHDEPTSQPEHADGEDDHQDEAAHDHETDHGSGEVFKLLPFLGRFHILIIHFPIALISIGALFELVGWLGRKPGFEIVVRATIGLGAISAVVAVLLGLANAIEADYSGTLAWVFLWHRALGIATAVAGLLAWFALEYRVRQPSPQRILFSRTTILLAAALVGVTGHFGGSLVYGWEYLLP